MCVYICRWWYLLPCFGADRQCLVSGRGTSEDHDCRLHLGSVIYQVRAFGRSVQQVPRSCHLQHVQAGSGINRGQIRCSQDVLLSLSHDICKWKKFWEALLNAFADADKHLILSNDLDPAYTNGKDTSVSNFLLYHLLYCSNSISLKIPCIA